MTKLRETGNILIWRGLVTTMYNPVRIFIVKQTICPRSLVVRRFSQWRGDIFSSGCLLWSIILVSDWCLPTCPRRVIIKDYITATYWVWDGWPTTYHLPLYLTGTSRHGRERERERERERDLNMRFIFVLTAVKSCWNLSLRSRVGTFAGSSVTMLMMFLAGEASQLLRLELGQNCKL